MSIEKHPEYTAENRRLEETKEYLERTIATLLEKSEKCREEIKDAYIHLDFLDSSLSYSSIMLNSKMLDEMEKNFGLLMKSRQKPYFARMDLKQQDKDDVEEFYIGKVSLFDETMDTPMVVDWRAPIASVYYDGRLGKTTYEATGIEYEIDLYKKRQYTIEEGTLVDYMDVDISTSDAFLQASLEHHAGEKLKDIVATIQEEQNTIIRADIEKPLIVQGVAGSGKTTIALHRIAYLIYTHSDTFMPEDFMIIAPNNLFLDYISGVLPELGAERVRQTTYIDFMLDVIGKKLKLRDTNEKLKWLVKNDADGDEAAKKQLVSRAAAYKNSMAMKRILDHYIYRIKMDLLPEEDFAIEGEVLLSSDEICHLVHVDYAYLPVYKRIDRLKQVLAKAVKASSRKILEKVEREYDQQLDRIRDREEPSHARTTKLVRLMNQRDEKLTAIKKGVKNAVNAYIDKVPRDTLLGFYQAMLTSPGIMGYGAAPEETDIVRHLLEEGQELFSANRVEVEDLAALVCLKHQLFGLDEALDIKYAVIDEAQDFSNFQFAVLREILNTDRFTILGDLSQGIHMYRSIENWDYVQHEVFSTEANFLTLEQSYRTTIEIMNLANAVLEQSPLDHLIMAKPVVRHGQKPVLKTVDDEKQLVAAISEHIGSLKAEAITTVAVITKTQEEARQLHKKLTKQTQWEMALIDEKTMHFDHQVVVMPAHLAKGLEFDAVIVATAKDRFAIDELDAKLLYVAMTRALHRLAVISVKGTMPCQKS
ncbi:MAG: RNA polymerase recycling motor HelD [Bacillota bacterium]|nr:RNA polymerase recycling motor HelD [Bacillota bacterium]MDW7677230.1 RNA polymerase recycling motor HelD [Bacillota bacterium]